MCLAQGPQRSDAGEARTRGPSVSSQALYHCAPSRFTVESKKKLEDLKVLRRSPDLFHNVKIGQGFTAYNKTYFVLPYMGVAAILVK